MALTLDAFLTSFPEFATTNKPFLAAKLAEALLSIDATMWGAKADMGQGYLAAHLITLSPTGQNARMVVKTVQGEQPVTTYWGHYKRLQREIGGAGASVAGGAPNFCEPWSPYFT